MMLKVLVHSFQFLGHHGTPGFPHWRPRLASWWSCHHFPVTWSSILLILLFQADFYCSEYCGEVFKVVHIGGGLLFSLPSSSSLKLCVWSDQKIKVLRWWVGSPELGSQPCCLWNPYVLPLNYRTVNYTCGLLSEISCPCLWKFPFLLTSWKPPRSQRIHLVGYASISSTRAINSFRKKTFLCGFVVVYFAEVSGTPRDAHLEPRVPVRMVVYQKTLLCVVL